MLLSSLCRNNLYFISQRCFCFKNNPYLCSCILLQKARRAERVGCDFYGIERLLTLICAIVNFATLQAVSRCGNE